MSGIIGNKGQQWEHCNCCGDYVRLQHLQYGIPNEQAKIYWANKFPEREWLLTGQKIDLCKRCA